MKILIIGGAGFLGLNFAKALLESKHKVHLLDKSVQAVNNLPMMAEMAGLYETDCKYVEDVLAIIEEQKIECVINMASGLLPASSFDTFENEIREALVPSFRLVNEIARKKIKYVYMSSGGTVYGQPDGHLVSEDDPKKPISLYGLSKVFFEQYVEHVSRISGLVYLILRPSNPYGFFQNPHRKQGLIAVAVDKVLKGEEIEVWGDGSVIRDYIWVEDLASAVVQLFDGNIWNQTFNIGSGVGFSVKEILKTIEDVSGFSAHCRFQEGRTADVSRIVLDISKLRSAVSFEPTNLRSGIEKYVEGLCLAST